MKVSMDHWWDLTDRGKQKYSEERLHQWRFVYHKFHRLATKTLSHGTGFEARSAPKYCTRAEFLPDSKCFYGTKNNLLTGFCGSISCCLRVGC